MIAFLDDHVAGGLGDDLERVEDRHAGREQRAERAREARDGDLPQHRAHDRELEHELVEELLPVRRACRCRRRRRTTPMTPRTIERQVADEASRDGDDDLGEPGQLVLRAEVLEHVLERRDDAAEQDADDADEDDEDGDRVDHRAATWRRELDRLLDVDGEAVEDRVEDAADLAGLDEVDVELVEDLRVPAERVAERRALLDVRLDVA